MEAIFGSLLGAIVALSGILITRRSTRVHDREMRLWEKRVDAYLELLGWIRNTYSEIGVDEYATDLRSASLAQRFEGKLEPRHLPSRELENRVELFGSDVVDWSFRNMVQTMKTLIESDVHRCPNEFNYLVNRLVFLRGRIVEDMAIREESTLSRLRSIWDDLLCRVRLRKYVVHMPSVKISSNEQDEEPAIKAALQEEQHK